MLAFRLGSIPVRIHVSFLLLTVFLAMERMNNAQLLVSWFLVVLVSVMLHELGHALMGKAFGLSPAIDLHGMGGTTSWLAGRQLSNLRSIAVSLAGPAVGIVLGLTVYFATRDFRAVAPGEELSVQQIAVRDIIWVNVGWGVLNLLPILPLDGGNVMRSTLHAITKGKGERAARYVSVVFAIAVGALAVWRREWWGAMLAALFAVQNFRAIKDQTDVANDTALQPQIDAAYDALRREDGAAVLAIAHPLLEGARTPGVRAEAIHLVAYGLLLQKRFEEADRIIATLPPGFARQPAYAELRDLMSKG